MLFSSPVFLFAFLPFSLLGTFLLPPRLKNAWLFITGLFFYSFGEPRLVAVMLVSVSVAFFLGFPIAKYRVASPKAAKAFLFISVAFSLSLLIFFKYTNFFIENFRRIPALQNVLTPIDGLVLPIGISFYTFQIISYTVDLYRGGCRLQKNYMSFGAYVTLFPQLIAGPIVRYSDIDAQLTCLKKPTPSEWSDKFSQGIVRFILGLSKKLILGDGCGAIYAYFAGVESSSLASWMMLISYSMHIYFDFSGYSDMAIGLGRMLGFEFPENFNYPYISRSVTDFWRRWHITLSSFFREYVYIPLGGNRCSKARQYFNLSVVWLLTGLWHGAAWTFVLWGVYYLALLIVEKSFALKLYSHLPRFVPRILTLFLVGVGWLVFASPNLRSALSSIGGLFAIGGASTTAEMNFYALRALPFLVLCAIFSTPLPKMLARKIKTLLSSRPVLGGILPVAAAIALFAVCVSYSAGGGFSPFLYFDF